MRQGHFEAIIDVQNRHIERLERMVEELFNVLRREKGKVELVQHVDQRLPDEEPEEPYSVPEPEVMPGMLFTDQ
jgi:asparagine synthetase A